MKSSKNTSDQSFFLAQGTRHEVSLTPLSEALQQPRAGRRKVRAAGDEPPTGFDPSLAVAALRASPTMRQRVHSDDPADLKVVRLSTRRGAAAPAAAAAPPTLTIATPTVIVEGARRADFEAARNLGAKIVDEGYDGKVLLKVETVEEAFRLVAALSTRDLGSVTPNFLRRVERLAPSTTPRAWAHAKIGVAEAWEITKGSKEVRVAVLDEGVDTSHPALHAAVFAERDFIGTKGGSAMPDGDDAHGTACAGIIVSRHRTVRGIAPRCTLIAARIAIGDGNNGWIFDDYATADAIDWSWRQGAAVLSNSWGGGAPSDAISRAFGRARTQGRDGKGAVVLIAAGNDQRLVDFPGNLPGYVTVGASTPRDERKTRASSDGEKWWGSNYGLTLWLLAPGVFIETTDIAGQLGYDPGNFTRTFNGTSSATPHVAAAAALMLSANPSLSASDVRVILATTARKLKGQTGWTRELGWGRLDVAAAVRVAAGRAPAGSKRTGSTK